MDWMIVLTAIIVLGLPVSSLVLAFLVVLGFARGKGGTWNL